MYALERESIPRGNKENAFRHAVFPGAGRGARKAWMSECFLIGRPYTQAPITRATCVSAGSYWAAVWEGLNLVQRLKIFQGILFIYL